MSPGWIRLRDSWLPPLLVLAVTLLVLPVGYMVNHPFWYDEAWVAVGTRAPLEYLLPIAFPSPPGWALLIRIPTPGEQGMRLLTLAFSAAAVYMAYLFGRDLGWARKRDAAIIGFVAGLAVVMSPWSLLRIDLKPYTAEAFMALVLLWMAGRVEKSWENRNIILLAVLSALFSVIGWTSMFVAVAVFASLFVVALFQRSRAAIFRLGTAGAVVAGVFGAVWWFLIHRFTWVLRDYWAGFYLEGNPIEIVRATWWRFSDLTGFYPTGTRFVLPVLYILGLVAIWRRRHATALAVVGTWAFMVALGVLELFPVLDRRTSHFLLIMTVAVAGVGIGWVAVEVLKRLPTWGTVVAVGMAVILVLAGVPWFNRPSLPKEDVRAQVRYVHAEREEGDVVLVSLLARYGFGWYWQGGRLVFNNTVHFTPRVVDDGVIIYQTEDIDEALAEAIADARAPGATGRVWFVRTHLARWTPEWEAAFARAGITPESIEVGPEPVQVFNIDR